MRGVGAMRKAFAGLLSIAVAALARTCAAAQQPVKVGVILAYSGQVADPSAQMDNGIKLCLAQHGDGVAERKLELAPRDTDGIALDIAKRLAQELIVRDKAD